MKTKLFKTQSLVLAIALLLTTLCAELIRPRVSADGTENSDAIVPSVNKECIIPMTDAKNWWGSVLTLSDVSDGGMKFDWKLDGKGARQGALDTVSLNGMVINFDKLSRTKSSAGVFAFVLANNPRSMDAGLNRGDANHSLFFVVDTLKGQISFANTAISGNKFLNNGTVLLSGDELKYENLSGKPFSVSFSKGDNGAFNITAGASGGVISADNALTAEMISKAGNVYNTDYLFVALSSWSGSNGLSIVLRSIEKYRRTDVTYTVPSTENMLITAENLKAWWSKYISISDAVCGGLHYDFTNAFRDIRQGIHKKVKLDGLYLTFDRLNPKTDLFPTLGIVFANKYNDVPYCQNGMFALAIDTVLGEIQQVYSQDFMSKITLVKDEKIKQLIGRPFTVSTEKQDDGSYKVYVRSDTDEFSAALDLTKAPLFDPERDAYVGITAGSAQGGAAPQSFIVDFIEIGNCSTTVDEVIAAINAIGTVTLESAPAIRNARSLFDQLKKFDANRVTNADKLVEAETEFSALAAAADASLKKLTLATALLSGSNNEAVNNTLYRDWKNFMRLSDIEGGGVHFEFTSAVRNVREGYGSSVSLDGLYIQFDNLSASAAEDCSLAIIAGNNKSIYGPTADDDSLVLVLDTAAGAIVAYPSGETVMSSEQLKFENITNRRFAYNFNQNAEGIWDMTVYVNGQSVNAVLPESVMFAATSLTNAADCRLMVTSWNKNQTYSFDFIGVKQSKLSSDEVIALIDDIGMLNIDSGAAIERASNAYNELSPMSKQGVYNYDILVSAKKHMEEYHYDTMIETAKELIDDIGEVTYRSGEQLDKAGIAVERLNAKQRGELSNIGTYYSALKAYNELTAPMLKIESYANGFSNTANNLWFSNDSIESWKGKMVTEILEDTSLQINFNNAIRDMRNGPSNRFALDGLNIRIGDITAEKGKNGTMLSVQIGPDTAYTNAASCMAFVIDTFSGSLKGYPADKVLISSESLLQKNIAGKELSMRFMLLDEGIYRLVIRVGNEVLSTTVPSSMILNPNYMLKPSSVRVSLSPWVNNDDALVDQSEHTFSVKLLSVQSKKYNAFEDVYGLIERIDALPSKISNSDITEVQETNAEYSALLRVLKSRITNYSKLESALGQAYELLQDDYSEWDSSAGSR